MLSKQLSALQIFRRAGYEVIVVDGGSHDSSVLIATPYADKIIHSPAGRAKQMNQGAASAKYDWLLFLHVDTQLPETALMSLQTAFSCTETQWGRFDVCLSGNKIMYKLISWSMNKRSRLTGIATGDQAIFVNKNTFNEVAGFPDIPLMEDIAISSRLKKLSKPVCLFDQVITSSRRWQNNGIIRTILVMWLLRLRYFFGANPRALAEQYNRMPK